MWKKAGTGPRSAEPNDITIIPLSVSEASGAPDEGERKLGEGGERGGGSTLQSRHTQRTAWAVTPLSIPAPCHRDCLSGRNEEIEEQMVLCCTVA